MEALTERLMGLFAEALGVPSDFFKDKIDKHVTNLVALRYPPMTDTAAAVTAGAVYSHMFSLNVRLTPKITRAIHWRRTVNQTSLKA